MPSQSNAIASSSKPHHHPSSHHHKIKSFKSKHKDKTKRDKRKDGKQEKETEGRTGPFEHRLSRMRLSVAPKFSADWLIGVREQLDGMLMRWAIPPSPRRYALLTNCSRYVPQMGGVLLAHWEHEFADDTVQIINECPYGVCEIQFRSILWAPKVGQRLCEYLHTGSLLRLIVADGTHSLSSPSHLSLLFSRTFNVSIPLQHIPQDHYEFEHTEGAEGELSTDSEDEKDEGGQVHEVGRWKSKKSGKLLGEGGKGIKFTVIG